MAFMQEIAGLGDQQIAQQVAAVLTAHIAEHYAHLYKQRIEQKLMAQGGPDLPPWDLHEPRDNDELPPDIEAELSRMIAAVMQQQQPQGQPGEEQDPQAAEQEAEMARMQAEEQRKDLAFQKDQQRKDAGFMADEQRKQAKTASDTEAKSAGALAKLLGKMFSGGQGGGQSAENNDIIDRESRK